MAMPELDQGLDLALSNNTTLSLATTVVDPKILLLKCWRLQSCGKCLQPEDRSISCGWCPYSNTCIPSSSILSPLTNSEICPMDDERWELRSSGLGCAVSTRTFLSVWASVLATLVFIALVYWGYYLWKRRERRRREWSLWGESGGYGGDEGGIWAWLGLDDVFGPWREEWGGWTRGWLLWRREEPERRVPGAWDDGEEEEGVGERRSLLRG